MLLVESAVPDDVLSCRSELTWCLFGTGRATAGEFRPLFAISEMI